MAKKSATVKNTKSIEETLWDAADKLRGSVEPGEYKHIVLALIFLKFASDRFVYRQAELVMEKQEQFLEMAEFYTMKNVFYLPSTSRWSYLITNATQGDLSIKIDAALREIEKSNKALKGALPDGYFTRLNLERNKLAALLNTINNIKTQQDKEQDIVGRIYEYFLQKFAIKEGKSKGEFYTPKSIVNLIAEMIEPYKGIIYDPCCGSGGMFVQSMKFVEAHQGNQRNVSIYGQEYTAATYKLAKMNLAIRGISANLGETPANTFSKDQHPDLKADYIMANPPFNQKDWRADDELVHDGRWIGYNVPPASNANYGWILHMVSKLSVDGVAGFILANGALSGGGEEYNIRRKMIENDLVEAIVVLPRDMFYTTDISVTLWILNRNKKARKVELNGLSKNYRDRSGEVLFMDLRRWGSEYEKMFTHLTENDIAKVASNYHNWQQVDAKNTYQDIPEYCYSASFDEIKANSFSLVPSAYIEFVDRDSGIDFDKEMQRIQQTFKALMLEEEESQVELKKAFKGLGYEI